MIPGTAAQCLPMAYGTLNWADVLGVEASPVQLAAPISSGGPNQSTVNPAFAGPGTMVSGGSAPTISLLGMVLLLVAWRVAVEVGSRE